jgi:ribonucleoside-triphosphate reductase
MSNSFHLPVWDEVTQIEKQNIEFPFYNNFFKGGEIQYCRYDNPQNLYAIKDIVRNAMDLGYYEGVNFASDFCNDCGEHFTSHNNDDTCPHCSSSNITRIDRVCGYLGLTKVKSTTRINKTKLDEILQRVSM